MSVGKRSPYPIGTFADEYWQLEHACKELWQAYVDFVERGLVKLSQLLVKVRKHKGPSGIFTNTKRAEEAFIEAIDELHEERRKHKVCREMNESILKQLSWSQKTAKQL